MIRNRAGEDAALGFTAWARRPVIAATPAETITTEFAVSVVGCQPNTTPTLSTGASSALLARLRGWENPENAQAKIVGLKCALSRPPPIGRATGI